MTISSSAWISSVPQFSPTSLANMCVLLSLVSNLVLVFCLDLWSGKYASCSHSSICSRFGSSVRRISRLYSPHPQLGLVGVIFLQPASACRNYRDPNNNSVVRGPLNFIRAMSFWMSFTALLNIFVFFVSSSPSSICWYSPVICSKEDL